jgi:hypothetical protein
VIELIQVFDHDSKPNFPKKTVGICKSANLNDFICKLVIKRVPDFPKLSASENDQIEEGTTSI